MHNTDTGKSRVLTAVWLGVFFGVLIWSGINPKDGLTWVLEVFPAIAALIALAPLHLCRGPAGRLAKRNRRPGTQQLRQAGPLRPRLHPCHCRTRNPHPQTDHQRCRLAKFFHRQLLPRIQRLLRTHRMVGGPAQRRSRRGIPWHTGLCLGHPVRHGLGTGGSHHRASAARAVS